MGGATPGFPGGPRLGGETWPPTHRGPQGPNTFRPRVPHPTSWMGGPQGMSSAKPGLPPSGYVFGSLAGPPGPLARLLPGAGGGVQKGPPPAGAGTLPGNPGNPSGVRFTLDPGPRRPWPPSHPRPPRSPGPGAPRGWGRGPWAGANAEGGKGHFPRERPNRPRPRRAPGPARPGPPGGLEAHRNTRARAGAPPARAPPTPGAEFRVRPKAYPSFPGSSDGFPPPGPRGPGDAGAKTMGPEKGLDWPDGQGRWGGPPTPPGLNPRGRDPWAVGAGGPLVDPPADEQGPCSGPLSGGGSGPSPTSKQASHQPCTGGPSHLAGTHPRKARRPGVSRKKGTGPSRVPRRGPQAMGMTEGTWLGGGPRFVGTRKGKETPPGPDAPSTTEENHPPARWEFPCRGQRGPAGPGRVRKARPRLAPAGPPAPKYTTPRPGGRTWAGGVSPPRGPRPLAWSINPQGPESAKEGPSLPPPRLIARPPARPRKYPGGKGLGPLGPPRGEGLDFPGRIVPPSVPWRRRATGRPAAGPKESGFQGSLKDPTGGGWAHPSTREQTKGTGEPGRTGQTPRGSGPPGRPSIKPSY